MSVVLGHEAYRDGKVGADNEQETRNAVIAHTKMAARMRAEGADFDNSFVGLDLAVYDYARSVGNMEIMEKYADALYDSSGDYWKLKTVMDANGNVTSYTVDWDDSLDLNIENADGTITEVAANMIQTESGIDSISQWFRANGLVFGDDIKQGFVSLGISSEATIALNDAINNEKNDTEKFNAIAANFTDSINALINSGLNIGELGTLPDESLMYSLMPDSTSITTLYGIRLITPELYKKATGTLYNWATYDHSAEDIAGGKVVQTPTKTKDLSMGWNDMTGFQVTIKFDNEYKLQSNPS
jgi:hypothetical protein